MSQRTLTAAKNLVRKDIKKRIKLLPNAEKVRQSKIISQKLFALDVYKNCKSVSTYLHMPSEVYTDLILTDIFQNEKKCYMPHYVGENMSMVRLMDQADYDALPLTSWNIKQPVDDEVRECAIDGGNGLDLIIVPALGFTMEGDRLGRGKGYYDKYFGKYESAFNKKPILVGLGYSCQIMENLPVDEYDVRLDHVLTV